MNDINRVKQHIKKLVETHLELIKSEDDSELLSKTILTFGESICLAADLVPYPRPIVVDEDEPTPKKRAKKSAKKKTMTG